MSLSMSALLVPTQDNTAVAVTPDSLPQDPQPLIDMLHRERVGIEYWLQISVSPHLLTEFS